MSTHSKHCLSMGKGNVIHLCYVLYFVNGPTAKLKILCEVNRILPCIEFISI